MSLNILRKLQFLQAHSKIAFGKSFFSNINRDVIKVGGVSDTKQDLLLVDLRNASNTNGVLRLVASHYKIMNSVHLMQALRSLFSLQKAGNSELSTQRILKHPDFEKICNRLKTQIGGIELNDTIEALKVVCFVGVSSESTIVQVLLQLIRYNINGLSVPQIIFLDFLLKQFDSSPLIDALKIALPLVFEIQLPTKMDRDDIAHIAEYLHYVSKTQVSEKCVESIVLAALKCRNKMDTRTASSIAWSLCDLKHDCLYEPLLKEALHVITANMHQLTFNEIETTLTKLINKRSPKSSFYYDELFMDVLCEHVIRNKFGLKQVIHVLRKFNKISYVNNNLLDYVAEEYAQDVNLILNDSLHAYNLTVCVAATDYRPPLHWNTLKTALETTDVFQNVQRKEIYWLKLAASLVTLDIYKRDVLLNAFGTYNLQNVAKKNYMSDAENFVLLYSFIALFKPEFVDLLPDKSVFEEFQRKIRPPVEFPLEACLHKGLGGDSYVMTNVRSELGFVIDHVILMRSGGFPVAFNSMCGETLEKLNTSVDSQIVLVLALPHFHYTVNCRRMKGTTALMIKILEAKGYTVVPICLDEWNDLPDFEKIPYVMRTIKSKTEFYENTSKSVYSK